MLKVKFLFVFYYNCQLNASIIFSSIIYKQFTFLVIFLYFCFSIAASFIFKTLFCITDVIWPQSWTNGCELFFGSPFSHLFIVEISVMRAEKLARTLFIFFSYSLTLNIGAKGIEKSLLTFCLRLLMILPFCHFVSLLFIGFQRDNQRRLIA